MPVDVSIIIPTYKRPEGLTRAAQSALSQANPCELSIELVIVDNDPAGSGLQVAEKLARETDRPVKIIHESSAGVANARNAGVKASSGELIAFLDDDEIAPPSWLCELVGTQRFYGADVVFGPVRTRLPEGIEAHQDYYKAFFARTGPEESGVIDYYFGCGNSLVRRSALPSDTPFAAERNETGGEDDLLFSQLEESGAVFAWSAEAWVWEEPLSQRATLKYTLRRAFAYGQGPTVTCATGSPLKWPGVIFWMGVGVVQAIIYGAAAAGLWIIGAPHRARMLDKAVRGLGKVFWGGPFRQNFYGQAA